MRSFSLYDSQRKLLHQRGGRSGFRNFLASIGHAARPILRGVERGLMNYGKQKLAKKIGVDAVQYGSELLKDLAQGKSIQDVAQSEEGRQLLQKGLKTGWDRIKGRFGGASLGVPSDINRALTIRNRVALQQALQPGRRRRRKSTAKKVAKKKAGSRKKGGKRKKAGSKRAGPAKRTKAGSKRAGPVKRSKRGGSVKSKRAGSKKKKVTFQKGAQKKSGPKKKGGIKKSILKKKGGSPKSLKSVFD